MSKIPLIIDCDPGVDDAIALFLAHTLDELDILGVTAVAGNVGLEHTYPNALKLCHMMALDVPVGKGAAQPLVKSIRKATVHGQDGLGGFADAIPLPMASKQEQVDPIDAVELIYDLLMKSSQKVTLLAIGPLTNLALLFNKYPDALEKIERIAVMGGGIDIGNITPYAEFNFYADPEAADFVMNCGLPIILVDLQLTHQARLPEGFLEKVKALNNPIANFSVDIIKAYTQYDAYLHDLLAVYTLTHPDLFEYQKIAIDVITEDGDRRGMSVINESKDPQDRQIQLATHFNRDDLFKLVLEGFSSYSQNAEDPS